MSKVKFLTYITFVFISFLVITSIQATPMLDHLATRDGSSRYPETYWIQNKGYASSIVFSVEGSSEALLEAIRNGEIDVAEGFIEPSQFLDSDYLDPSININSTELRGYTMVQFHGEMFPTNIRALRQGFAYALDKQGISNHYDNNLLPIDSVITPSMGIWSCEHELSDCSYPNSVDNGSYYQFQLQQANLTILGVGWYDIDGDGWREFFNGTIEGEWSGPVISTNNRSSTYDYNGYTQMGRTFNEVAASSGNNLTSVSSGPTYLKEDYRNLSDWLDLDDPTNESSARDYLFDLNINSSRTPFIEYLGSKCLEAYHQMGIGVRNNTWEFQNSDDLQATFKTEELLDPLPFALDKYTSTSVSNKDHGPHWWNDTFDSAVWTIYNAQDEETVLLKTYQAQHILWQEQPVVVIGYNKSYSVCRTDLFARIVNVPGEGLSSFWTPISTHLTTDHLTNNNYPSYPFGGSFRYGLKRPLPSLNSLQQSVGSTTVVNDIIEETLVQWHPQDLTPMFLMAESVETEIIQYQNTINWNGDLVQVEAGTKLTWHLRENMTWHDGDQVTAEDLEFSYKMIATNDTAAYGDRLKHLINVRRVGEYAVELIINQTGIMLPLIYNIKVYPEHIWSNVPGGNVLDYANSVPIGTGPYKWVSGGTKTEFTLVRNSDYYFRPSDEIHLYSMNDDTPDETTTTEASTTSGFDSFSLPTTVTTTEVLREVTTEEGSLLVFAFQTLIVVGGGLAIGGLLAIATTRQKKN